MSTAGEFTRLPESLNTVEEHTLRTENWRLPDQVPETTRLAVRHSSRGQLSRLHQGKTGAIGGAE